MTRSGTNLCPELTNMVTSPTRENSQCSLLSEVTLTSGVVFLFFFKKGKLISVGRQQCLPHLYKPGHLLSGLDNPMKEMVSLFTYIKYVNQDKWNQDKSFNHPGLV